LKVGWQHRGTRCCLFSLGQCLLSFVQCFLARIQLGFPLSELLFRRCILFLAGANHCQRNKHREDKEFFHIRGRILIFRQFARTNRDSGY
jgi:hypothetical protein